MSRAKMVMMPKNVFDCRQEDFLVPSQQSLADLRGGTNLKYQAKARIARDRPINQGLTGSNQERFVARLLLPAIIVITGVIQQSEAAMADTSPAIVNAPGVFIWSM